MLQPFPDLLLIPDSPGGTLHNLLSTKRNNLNSWCLFCFKGPVFLPFFVQISREQI